MSLQALWVLLLGAVVPFVVGFLSRCKWGPGVKWLGVLMLSAGVGFGTIWVAGGLTLTWANAIGLIGATVMAAQTTYRYVIDKLPAVKSWLDSHWITGKEKRSYADTCLR